ncbi:TetR/AcrR family transcriptional regulator [Mycobacteroides chelonae]|uniref:TetR/AcrR family transcriptional regulator n=1 Tax=Mycobacteroides chelonae TaxID=1774 RepID=UPI0004AB8689|nr:TetR/AcrR family transcriptional regulator [Mycobacteroides chelonae]OHT70858.1 TetR family transcriptional regulator [Mycobacteroides chelonae]OHT71784.1 TetR family transcriptional regulator [Mycobacteroides chelonae]OHT86291.1 TetR family transcriptional regulator [Mycobacteroides chelonae]
MKVAASDSPREDIPEPIVTAVAMTLVRSGMQRFNLSAAAEQAGVSRSTLYNWFGGKQAAIDTAFGYLADAFIDFFAAAVGAETTLVDQVAAAASGICEHRRWTDHLALHTTDLLDLILDERGEDLMARSVAFWTPRIREAQERKEIPGRIVPEEAAEWIIRTLMSIEVLPPIVIDLSDPAAVRRYFADYITHGLGAARD